MVRRWSDTFSAVRPTNLNNSGARPTVLSVAVGWGLLDIFLSLFISFFLLPLSGRRSDID